MNHETDFRWMGWIVDKTGSGLMYGKGSFLCAFLLFLVSPVVEQFSSNISFLRVTPRISFPWRIGHVWSVIGMTDELSAAKRYEWALREACMAYGTDSCWKIPALRGVTNWLLIFVRNVKGKWCDSIWILWKWRAETVFDEQTKKKEKNASCCWWNWCRYVLIVNEKLGLLQW